MLADPARARRTRAACRWCCWSCFAQHVRARRPAVEAVAPAAARARAAATRAAAGRDRRNIIVLSLPATASSPHLANVGPPGGGGRARGRSDAAAAPAWRAAPPPPVGSRAMNEHPHAAPPGDDRAPHDHDDLHAAPTEKISVRAGELAGRSDDPAAATRLPRLGTGAGCRDGPPAGRRPGRARCADRPPGVPDRGRRRRPRPGPLRHRRAALLQRGGPRARGDRAHHRRDGRQRAHLRAALHRRREHRRHPRRAAPRPAPPTPTCGSCRSAATAAPAPPAASAPSRPAARSSCGPTPT